MKEKRQDKIFEIIERREIETQEELLAALREEGFNVTQATVSRDIRDLKLQKIMTVRGKYKYVMPRPGQSAGEHPIYSSTLASSVTGADYAMNLVVIKTYPGMAQAVALALDSMTITGVLGCIAGDDTVFLAARDAQIAAHVAGEVRKTVQNRAR